MKKRFLIYIIAFLLIAPAGVFSQVRLRETVWLQLERDLFIAGENICFRAELLENDTYKPSVLSNSIRLELTDSQGNNIKRLNILLENSEASGKIEIPANLATGWYFLRCYTNWMRNFDDKYITYRVIRIYNPEDDNFQTGAAIGELKLEITPYTDPYNGRSMCSVYASDKHGSPVRSHGFILSGPRDTVLYFKTDRTGWAGSYYNAAHVDRYQVFAENVSRENISFEINDNNDLAGGQEISISEKYGYLNINILNAGNDEEYKVFVHRLYSWSWFDKGRSERGQLSFRIPLKDLPSGISQVAILDEANNEIFRRLWSDYSEVDQSIRIEEGHGSVGPGEEQSFEFISPVISARDTANRFKLIVHADVPGSDIYAYLPGLPGWPALSEIPSGDEAFRAWLYSTSYVPGTAAAFFMQNTEDPSPPVFSSKEGVISYYPDARTGTIRGRIKDNQGKAVALKNVAMTILNDNLFAAARTDEEGFFAFTFPGLHGSKDYFLNYYNGHEPSWVLALEESFAGIGSIPQKGKISFTEEEIDFLRKQGMLLQIRNIYSPGDSSANGSQDSQPPVTGFFYGKPDFSIELDEYIKLPDLREVFLEVVPFVAVRQREGRNVLFSTGENLLSGDSPALVLLDGVPLDEYDELLAVPPERIQRIEGVNDFYAHGNAVLPGIVNILSRNRDFAGLKIPRSAIISSVQLPEEHAAFKLTGDPAGEGYPSIDNIVIWDKLKPSSANTVTVKMSDYPGSHTVSVYGFDSYGRWYRGVKRFDVN